MDVNKRGQQYIKDGYIDIKKDLFNLICRISNKNVNIHTDIYINSPYILMGRVIEKKAMMQIKDNRLQVIASDKYNTMLVNILMDTIKKATIIKYSETLIEINFIFKDSAIHYRISIEL